MHLQVDAGGGGRRAQLVDRVVDQDFERGRRTTRRFLGLDEAEIEEVVDDARQPLRLLDDPFGQRTRDRGVVLGDERLRQHLERADRGLELVADVGDEVAPHALDAVHVGDVGDERGHTQRAVSGAERHRREVHDRARRAEELQLALAGLAVERARHERVERAGDDRVGVAGLAVALGGGVAEHLDPVGIEDEHALAQLVEHRQEPVALLDQRVGLALRLAQRLFQRGSRLVASLRAHRLNRSAR